MRKNLAALYGVQIANLALPLISVPFLARSLKPDALGELAAIQSLFGTLGFLIEYGFSFSATKDVSIHRENPEKLKWIFSKVIAAKLILSLAFLILSISIYFIFPISEDYPALFWVGFAGALFYSFNPIWFYQGIEKAPRAAATDIFIKSIYVAIIIFLVKEPDDVLLVIVLQSIANLLSTSINTYRIRNMIDTKLISISEGTAAIKEGRSMFLFRSLTVFYSSANTAILRFFVPAATVAYYSSAERLMSVGFSAMSPMQQVLFPRLSALVHHNYNDSKRFFKKCLAFVIFISLTSSLCGYLLSPFAIKLVFGPEYQSAIPIFKILVANIFFVSLSGLFGINWMIPNKMVREFNIIIAIAAFINIVSIIIVVPAYGALGMAWAVTGCEATIAVLMILAVCKSNYNPFSK